MERDQKATVILDAIDKQAPVDIDWNKSKVWMAAIMRGLRDVEQMEAEERNERNLYGMQESAWKEFCRLAAGVAMDPRYLIAQMVTDLVDENREGHEAAGKWFAFWKCDTYADTSYVSYLFRVAGGPDEVLQLNDDIQSALDDLECNEADEQIAIRGEIGEYMDRMREWYRQYMDYYGDRRADKTLAEAMGRLILWRARSRAQGQKNKRVSWCR